MEPRKSNSSTSSHGKPLDLMARGDVLPHTSKTYATPPNRVFDRPPSKTSSLKNRTPLQQIETQLAVASPQTPQAMLYSEPSQNKKRSGSMQVYNDNQLQTPVKRTASPAKSDLESGDSLRPPLRKRNKVDNLKVGGSTPIGWHKTVTSLQVAATINCDGELDIHICNAEDTSLKFIKTWESIVEDTNDTRVDLKNVLLDRNIFRAYGEDVDQLADEKKIQLVKQYLTSKKAACSYSEENGDLVAVPVKPSHRREALKLSITGLALEVSDSAYNTLSVADTPLATPTPHSVVVGHHRVDKNVLVRAYLRKDSTAVLFKVDEVEDSDFDFPRKAITEETLERDVEFDEKFKAGDLQEVKSMIVSHLIALGNEESQSADNITPEEVIPSRAQPLSPGPSSVSDVEMGNSETTLVAMPLPSRSTILAGTLAALDKARMAVQAADDYERGLLLREEQVAIDKTSLVKQIASFQKRERKLETKEKKLAERERLAAKWEAEIEKQKAWIEERMASLTLREGNIAPREAEVKRSEDTADEDSRSRREKWDKIRATEKAVTGREAAVTKRETAVTKREKSMENRKAAVDIDKEEISMKQSELESKKVSFEKKEAEFTRMQQALTEHETQADNNSKEIFQLQKKVLKLKAPMPLDLHGKSFSKAFGLAPSSQTLKARLLTELQAKIPSDGQNPGAFYDRHPRTAQIFPADHKFNSKTFQIIRILQPPISVDGTPESELLTLNGRDHIVYKDNGLLKLQLQKPETLLHSDGKVYVCWYLYKEIPLKF